MRLYHVEKSCADCRAPCAQPHDLAPWRISSFGTVFDDNRILLVRKRDGREWTLPGGTVWRNETPLKALRRHVRKAAGLRILATQVPTVIECPHRHRFLMYYQAAPATTPEPLEPQPAHDTEARWFSMHSLPVDLARHAKTHLLQFNLRRREPLQSTHAPLKAHQG